MAASSERTALNPGAAGASSLYFVPGKKGSSSSGALSPQRGVEMKQLSGGPAIDVGDGDGDFDNDDQSGGLSSQLSALRLWFGSLVSSNPYTSIDRRGGAGGAGGGGAGGGGGSTAAKPRKVPVKVEPKVFFANERTFLAWLHMSVTLASISVAIVAFAEANRWSQIYGLLLMPCAIAFCGYSLWMYIKRAGMIRRKDPGPYEDLFGPIVLSAMLALSIIVNFSVKLFEYSTR